jgi:erythromycin esterase
MRGIIIIVLLLLLLPGYSGQSGDNSEPEAYFSSKAIPFGSAADMDTIIALAGRRRLVLLGESSHGTHEFYRLRAEISRRLISEKGFAFIVVEGDWASIYRLNKYVKGLDRAMSSAHEVLNTFDRWPQWMWSNTDILELAEWLKEHNEPLPPAERIGFYGMDVYGQWEAMEDLLRFTTGHIPDLHDQIAEKLHCFASGWDDEWHYATSVAGGGVSCEDELHQVVELIISQENRITEENAKAWFRALQNALVVRNAESYYRLAVYNDGAAWNSRVDHMWQTVQRLMHLYGDSARAIVWAHNTHVGDSRATTMKHHNQYNIGALSRMALGEEQVFIAGFGTLRGKVNAAASWGAPMQSMTIPQAQRGSLDYFLGKVPYDRFFILFNRGDREHPQLKKPLGHRAIGVVYNPLRDAGNYVPTLPAHRYDALLFYRKTNALKPLK